MSTTTTGSVAPSVERRPPGFTGHHRLVTMLVAALLGLALALNPMAAPTSQAVVPFNVSKAALAVATAQIGIPYRYGGVSRSGFDCSGLTKYSYARVGEYLPRTAQQQYNATIRVSWGQKRLGDLVFFYSGNTIYHVGIYAGSGTMIVAPHTGTLVQRQHILGTHFRFGRVRGPANPAQNAANPRVFSSGDFTGDRRTDIMGITPAGALYLYRGNGRGGFTGGGIKIGAGWGTFSGVFSSGDFTGDGRTDIQAITPAGALYLYRGNGRSGFTGGGIKIGAGWGTFR